MLPVFLFAWISVSKWERKKAVYLHKVLLQLCDSNTSSEWVESEVPFATCNLGQTQFMSRAHTVTSTAHRLAGGGCSETALWHTANILRQDNSLQENLITSYLVQVLYSSCNFIVSQNVSSCSPG